MLPSVGSVKVVHLTNSASGARGHEQLPKPMRMQKRRRGKVDPSNGLGVADLGSGRLCLKAYSFGLGSQQGGDSHDGATDARHLAAAVRPSPATAGAIRTKKFPHCQAGPRTGQWAALQENASLVVGPGGRTLRDLFPSSVLAGSSYSVLVRPAKAPPPTDGFCALQDLALG